MTYKLKLFNVGNNSFLRFQIQRNLTIFGENQNLALYIKTYLSE